MCSYSFESMLDISQAREFKNNSSLSTKRAGLVGKTKEQIIIIRPCF